MTARRAARARLPVSTRTGPKGVPHSLLIGRCIEVWGKDSEALEPYSTIRRYNSARRHFLDSLGINTAEAQELLPFGSPWSVEYLTYRDQAERVGRPGSEIVADRLGRAGCTVADLPWLREQADELVTEAERDLPQARRSRR